MKSESSTEHFDGFCMSKTLQRSSSVCGKNIQPSYSTPIISKYPIKDVSSLRNDKYEKQPIKQSSVNNASLSLKELIAQKCKKLTLNWFILKFIIFNTFIFIKYRDNCFN